MQSPSVVSNGAKVRGDETEVLAGFREVTGDVVLGQFHLMSGLR